MTLARRQFLLMSAAGASLAMRPDSFANAKASLVGVDWGGPLIEAVKAIGERYNGANITWDIHSGGAATTMPKIKAAWPNPRYDFLAVYSLNYITMINEGWLEPMTFDDVPNLRDIPPELYIFDKGGSMVAAPRSAAAYFWGYRSDISPLKIESTEQLLDPRLKGQICWPGPMITGNTPLLSVALANGGSEENLEPGWDFLKKLAKSGNIGRVAHTETDFINAMTTGETSVAFWSISPWAKVAANFPVVALTRQGRDKGLKAFFYQDGWVVLKSSKNKKAAFDFINFAINAANNQAFNQRTGQVPTNKAANTTGFGKVITYKPDEMKTFGYFPNYEVLASKANEINKRYETEIIPLL